MSTVARRGLHVGLLERRFQLTARDTTVRREVLGGVATFLTMSYIVFVNPAILSSAGMPFAKVAVVTALAAGVITMVMGLAANLPIALASGLGINAVVAFDLILGQKIPWQVGMSCVVIEGTLALLLVLLGVREAVVKAVPPHLRIAIGVGIGLFLAIIGLRDGGIVVNNPATGIALGDLTTGPALISLAGIFVGLMFMARNARGAILAGIATSTVLGLIFGVLKGPTGVLDMPSWDHLSIMGDSLAPSNLADALTWTLVPTIFALFMSDFFDTIGTAYSVTAQADLLDENGDVPNMRNLLLVDSAAAAGGGVAGVSSVTSYIESGAGVGEGARTGLASVVTGLLFLLTVFTLPLITLVAQDVELSKGVFIHPTVAPALVLVAIMMCRLLGHEAMDWTKPEVAIPTALIIVGIPFTFSIAAGIGLGVIGFVAVMVASGKGKEVHPIMWGLVAPLFVAYFASDWLSANVF